MTPTKLRECEDCGEVVRQFPVFAGLVAIAVGTFAYAALSLVTEGRIDIRELGLFAVVFGVVHTGATFILRGRGR